MSDKNKTPDRVIHSLTRRQFIHHAGAAAATITVVGTSAKRAAGKESSPNERIGVGFIGCGGRSQAHLQAVNYLKGRGENVDIVAACDAYKPRMQKVTEGYNAKGYADHRELLADPNVDVVCIATPDHNNPIRFRNIWVRELPEQPYLIK